VSIACPAPEIDAELGESFGPDEEDAAHAIAAAMRRNIEKAYPPGKRPARRDAHPKAHGCVRATFRVEEGLPPQLAQGVFVPGKSYAAWIRFSNGDGNPNRADAKGDSRGMAIKLLGVPGEKILPEEKDAQTQDFLMITHPVFIVDDAARYLALIERSGSRNPFVRALAPLTLGIRGALNALATTRATIASPLETRYWSTTAYRLGTGARKLAVKYSARPLLPPTATPPRDPGPDFLRGVMAQQLAEREFGFDFLVQPRSSSELSVERSTVEWAEGEAPFHKVATISIPRQTFSSTAQDVFCENLSFTPWHSLPEHRPLGSINRVRRVVYEEISRARHRMNGVPRPEPEGNETFEV
jgi:Catalase